MALGWSIFLFTAFRDPVKNMELVKAILLAGGGAIAGLSIINFATDFQALSPEINVTAFWLETAVLPDQTPSLMILKYANASGN